MTSNEPKTPSGAEETGAESESAPATEEVEKAEKTVSTARADLVRLGKIVGVLTRHGFHQFVGKRRLVRFLGKAFIPPDDEELAALEQPEMAALRFRKVLEELGPTFIKLGQVLSTRPDLLPRSFVTELERLQDDAPPVDFEEIRAVVESSLGRSLDEAFAHFKPTPLASASMAQVHVARTHEGDEVVVKVIRPDVAALIEADLDLMHLLARMLEAIFAEMELYAPGQLVETFDKALKTELDLGEEARVLQEFARNCAHIRDLAVPAVYPELSSAQVLTLELLRGEKVSRVETGSDEARRLIEIGLEATFQQIFEDGLFHGDPHPGNLMSLEDGRLGLIDFGLVGRLTPAQQDTLVNLLVAVISGDVDAICKVVLRMGRPLGRVDMRELREVVSAIRHQHLRKSLAEVNAAQFVQDLIEAGQRFRIRVTPEYAILAKAAVTMEGVLRSLDPDLDIVATAKPFAVRLIRRRMSAKRLIETGISGLLSVASMVREAPQQLDQVLMDLNAGTLRFEVYNERLEELGNQVNVMTTRLLMAVLAAGLFVASALLVRDDPWHVLGIPVATTLSLLSAMFFSLVGLAWHAIGAGSGKLSLSFLAKLFKRRRLVVNRKKR